MGSAMIIDPVQIRRLARLAGIRVSAAETERLARDLSGVLTQIGTLRDVDLGAEGLHEDEEAAFPGEGRARADDADDDEKRAPDALKAKPSALAPDWRDGFFVVPPPSGFGEEG